MFNALSRNTRQCFMVLATAVAIVFTAGTVARGATVLHGPAARKAVERALLPYIMQYRLIKSIQFTAVVNQNLGNATVPLAVLPPRIKLRGIYKFWADGDRYRIDWQVLKSNYQPVMQQLWAFDGRRYESLIGAGGELVVSHRRNIGGMGPGESNPILSPIQNLCWRATARQPGDWLNWRRVRQFPHAVDVLPENINIGYYKSAGDKIRFSYNYGGERWPARWSRAALPPASFRAGRIIWMVVTLLKRGSVWLPVSRCSVHAGIVRGRRTGQYYSYTAMPINGKLIYLPRAKLHIGAVVISSLRIRHLRVNGRIDPAAFTINFDRAPAYFERDRIINISHLPAAPARTQHLGNVAAGGGKPAAHQ